MLEELDLNVPWGENTSLNSQARSFRFRGNLCQRGRNIRHCSKSKAKPNAYRGGFSEMLTIVIWTCGKASELKEVDAECHLSPA